MIIVVVFFSLSTRVPGFYLQLSHDHFISFNAKNYSNLDLKTGYPSDSFCGS
jgi:hypothetical protein